MLKYKVGDKVKVLSGKDKGREGEIAKIYPLSGKALVHGINTYKKHVKASVAADGKGGVYELPRPIYLSKLAIIDPKTKKPTRVGFVVKAGKKVRIAKKSGEALDITTKTSKPKTKKK